MNGLNPYNCTQPGNLFVGYERVRRKLLSGFRNGNSFALLGGRRMGKTSLLMQIERDLQEEDLSPFTPLPRYLDIQGLGQLTPALLFESIYSLVVREVEPPSWSSGEPGREYQDFLEHLEAASAALDQKYGSDWLVILLVDELDAAISSLPDDQFFQNMRNLLMVSRFHRHFRVAASGVNEMTKLISSGSSPLNNLRNVYLGVLTGKQARQLISFGFPDGLDPEIELLLFQLTGGHPYLLQGLLEKLWEDKADLDKNTVKSAARDFLREHHDFHRWMDAFSEAAHATYQLLSEAPEGAMHVRDIRHKMDSLLAPEIDDALTILSYHGVIDDSRSDEPQIAGTMFRDWYEDNRPRQNNDTNSQPAPTIRLFYSYSHKDEAMRDALETHLAILKRQEFIASWHDRGIAPGEKWKDQIDRNLGEADIILLLVSADFLASDYCYEIEMKQALERHEAGEARVIPVILRPVDWKGAPFGKLQALPRDAKPVSIWEDPDEAWTDVARGIREMVEELRKRSK